jgi:hypothetical protein
LQIGHRFKHVLYGYGNGGIGLVRVLAGEHLKQDDAEGIDVGTAVQFPFTLNLFRAHVGWGAHCASCIGELGVGVFQFCRAKIRNIGLVALVK